MPNDSNERLMLGIALLTPTYQTNSNQDCAE